MKNLLELLNNEININTNHITNFPLETEEGTKKIKEKFHLNAIIERNNYINKEKEKFLTYKQNLYLELKNRATLLLPEDKNSQIIKKELDLQKLEKLVILSNTHLSSSYKLNLDLLISQIKEDISLNDLILILKKFIETFSNISITLTSSDFKYTMFTERFMISFFKNYKSSNLSEEIQDIFEKIYFKCPDIINQLRLNLEAIVQKYYKELDKSISLQLEKEIKNKDLTSQDIFEQYLSKYQELATLKAKDEYSNLSLFLDKTKNINDYLETSPTRIKIFNQYAPNEDFTSLDDSKKQKFYEAIIALYNDLKELKEYYRYESIVEDLIKKYNDQKNSLATIASKEKEFKNEDKQRQKLLSKYYKSIGIGLFAIKNKTKSDNYRLQVNEQIKKLDSILNELKELSIYQDLSKNINNASRIYDLLICSLSNYSYLKNQFQELFKEDENFNLEEEFTRFLHFLLNPNNYFIRKVNALTEFKINEIIADKYKLLSLNITSTDIDTNTIEITYDNISFIKLVYDIENSKLPLDKINFICKQQSIPIDDDLKNLEPDSEIL